MYSRRGMPFIWCALFVCKDVYFKDGEAKLEDLKIKITETKVITVGQSIAYELDDLETPVTLVATQARFNGR